MKLQTKFADKLGNQHTHSNFQWNLLEKFVKKIKMELTDGPCSREDAACRGTHVGFTVNKPPYKGDKNSISKNNHQQHQKRTLYVP